VLLVLGTFCAAAPPVSADPIYLVVNQSDPAFAAVLSQFDPAVDGGANQGSFVRDNFYPFTGKPVGTFGSVRDTWRTGGGEIVETESYYFALLPNPSDVWAAAQPPPISTGTSTTTQVADFISSGLPYAPFFAGDPYDNYVAQGLTLQHRNGSTLEQTIINLIGVGDPESPDFIPIHTDYLEVFTFIDQSFSVPEPSSVAMLTLGGAMLGGFAWRRSRHRGSRALG